MQDLVVPDFTKNDYLHSTEPYEWVYQFNDSKFQMQQVLSIVREKARKVQVNNFATLFKTYVESLKQQNGEFLYGATDFSDQPLELECGPWNADDTGIYTTDKFGFEVLACNHPIMPVKRLVNIDTGIEKIELAYRKGRGWRKIIADKKTLASANSIIQLADYGVAVNSENAKHLVRYLTDIEHLNYERLEEVNSVGRLGWIDGYGFSPYVENLVFDGDISFKHFFESVSQRGSYEKWVELCKEVRKNGTCARIMLAASFASALVKPCGALPFFVHLWGGTETGKTVGLMLAASVWANPEMGKYIHTFNSTAVAQELSAGFVNSMPLILDELQIVKDRRDFDNLIYQLTEGIGRARGQKTGGLQRVASWQNCFLTTGEMPIGTAASGGGAVNRIIEIDCQDVKLFEDPVHVAETVKREYGFAGRQFVDILSDSKMMDHAVSVQKRIYRQLSDGRTTEKQALSASLILAADQLAEEWIFRDGKALQISDIEPYLSTSEQVSQNKRALQYLVDFVSINQNKFVPNIHGEYQGEIWGALDDPSREDGKPKYIYIIRSQFDKILRAEGYSPEAFLSWAKQCNTVETAEGKNTKTKRINGKVCRCVWIKRNCCEENDEFVEMEQQEIRPIFD